MEPLPREWYERDAPLLAPLLLGKLLVSTADPDPPRAEPAGGDRRHRDGACGDTSDRDADASGGARRLVVGRITEVEAYAEHDPASHTFRGPTPRNRVMFGPGGHLYVYLSYGIHRCANVVVGAVGSGQAVLLRAVQPIDGIDTIRERRGGRPDRSLVDGPGKLCEGFGIGLHHNGVDLTVGRPVAIVDDGVAPPTRPLVGPRVGISRAVDVPWRFRVPPEGWPG
jgi:DNA-3-methyladenine glycosylase